MFWGFYYKALQWVYYQQSPWTQQIKYFWVDVFPTESLNQKRMKRTGEVYEHTEGWTCWKNNTSAGKKQREKKKNIVLSLKRLHKKSGYKTFVWLTAEYIDWACLISPQAGCSRSTEALMKYGWSPLFFKLNFWTKSRQHNKQKKKPGVKWNRSAREVWATAGSRELENHYWGLNIN